MFVLRSQFQDEKIQSDIEARRPVVDFAEVYMGRVEKFLQQQVKAEK